MILIFKSMVIALTSLAGSLISTLDVATFHDSYYVELPPVRQEGIASFYGAGERGMHGKITATGETFDPSDQTCASRTLPLNSFIIVENPETGKWAYCRVNDRGPYGAVISNRFGGGWGAMFKRRDGYVIRRRDKGRWANPEKYKTRPGTYRGILDMSFGTAKALGVNLDRGLNRVRIRYWTSNPRHGYSPLLVVPSDPEPQCAASAPLCGNVLL